MPGKDIESKDKKNGGGPIPTLTGVVIVFFILYQILFGASPSRFGFDSRLESLIKIMLACAIGISLLGIVVYYFLRMMKRDR
jgi:hypothetical protein